jgi:hypothetical protein
MKSKCGKKSNRGRKPNRAVFSGIKPEEETFDEICCRFAQGSPEWPMVALQSLIKSGSQLPSNYLSAPADARSSPYAQRTAGVYSLWNRLCQEFECAVLKNDFDWFRRQAYAIEKRGLPQRAQFYAKVVSLFDQVRQENWRRLSKAEREAFPNLRRVPQVTTFTPAGKFTDKRTSDIYNALDKRELPNGLLLVEGWRFENKERVLEAIHDLAKRLQFELKKQPRKKVRPARGKIAR